MSMLHTIALTFIPGIGHILGKKLVAVCGSAEAVFTERRQTLLKADGIGEIIADLVIKHRGEALVRAESEMEFVQRHRIGVHFYTDEAYPLRLKECIDSPLVLYCLGNTNLNAERVVAVVGTRRATSYGKDICQQLIEGLSNLNVLVVSGLAYGIDTCAHKSALDNGLQTVGVLAHGLDRIYPPLNAPLAKRMILQGGLVTDYPSNTNPDRENFPTRNRIIAGLADAVVVVEAGIKGGALITAEIANSYNRDVFAIPGRLVDYYSEGCNNLIKTNRAHLVQSAADIRYIMGWDEPISKQPTQTRLLLQLSAEEEAIVEVLKGTPEASIDKLCTDTGLTPAKAANALLQLEFEGIVKCLPGKMYKLT